MKVTEQLLPAKTLLSFCSREMSFNNINRTENVSGEHTGHEWLLGAAKKDEKTIDLVDPVLENDDEDFLPVEERGDRNSRLSFSSTLSFSSATSSMHPNNSAKMSLFLLLNNMIGSGILNQPYVYMNSGFAGASLAYIIAVPACYVGLMLMTAAGIQEHILEYSGLAKLAFPTYGESLVDLSIIIQCFGSQLGYLVVVGSTLSSIMDSWGCGSDFCGQYLTTILCVIVFISPACFLRHFGHLTWISIFSVASIVIVMLLVTIVGPIKRTESHGSHEVYEYFNPMGFMQSFGSIVLSISCTSANFQAFISTEKKSRNLKSWRFVAGGTTVAGSFMCIVMGVFGYYSFAENTEGQILDNFSSHPYDFFRLMVAAHLLFYIPVNFIIMRYSVCKLFLGVRSELMPMSQHVFMTVFLLVSTTAIVLGMWAAGLTSGAAFTLILSLTGGIAGSLSTLILPAAIYLKLMDKDSDMYFQARVIFVFGIIVFCVVVPISVMHVL